MLGRILVFLWLAAAAAVDLASDIAYHPGNAVPAEPAREFRGVWIATVGNINWPSKPGLNTDQQKAELRAILDRAVELRLNAVLFQVRPACDALYRSSIEPWSEYLTGQMGKAPEPFYDPLAFAIEQAHQRGLELHAWFNPFRARFAKAISSIASNHVSHVHHAWVKTYGKFLWLDPGEKLARDYSLRVIIDVVRRYDIDGVHLDDYFYPYPEKDSNQQPVEFPDGPGWNRYRAGGGKRSKEDWRRDNVDAFVRQFYQRVKAEKPFLKVGISPFGIWRPGFPDSIRGFDSYAKLFADSRKWLAEGWLDYLAPQLYWSVESPEQSFPVLLKWWLDQNPKHRQIWPGLAITGQDGKRPASEILHQIRITRQTKNSTGNILWGATALMENKAGISDALATNVYAQPALPPRLPQKTARRSNPPVLTSTSATNSAQPITFAWHSTKTNDAPRWLLQLEFKKQSRQQLLPSSESHYVANPADLPDLISIRALDRFGNLGPPAVLARSKKP